MAMNEGGASGLEKILGKRIQTFRRSAGLTQQQLCNSASISYSTLTKIERGAIKSPSIFTVEAIASAIGVSLDEIIGSERASNSTRDLKKSASGVRFIYFDVNGCLVRFYQRAFSKIAEEYMIPADVVETAFWHFNDQACRGKLSLDEFNHELANKVGIPSIDWKSYYLEAAESVPAANELVKWAHKSYKVGLLTNIMPGFLSALRKSGQVPDLNYDAVIDSSEVGFVKPETKIYEIAEARAGVRPEEILLVDDTRGNLTAAEQVGWHVLWFDYANPDESVEHIRQALNTDM